MSPSRHGEVHFEKTSVDSGISEEALSEEALGHPASQNRSFLPQPWRSMVIASCIILFIGTIVPLLMLAPYARPSADDYSYGLMVHRAVADHGNPLDILRAAFDTVVFYWLRWQGSFSGMFFMALQPGCFATSAYVVVPFITLGFLCLGIFFLSYTLMVSWLKLSRSLWLSVASLISALAILQQPSALDSFFWYNAGMYYTSFFGVLLIYTALLFRLTYQDVRHHALLSVLISVLAFIISGGNYVALVLVWEITLILFVICGIRPESRSKLVYCIVPTLILLIGSLVNCLAPGNSGRADALHGMSAPKTILYAITTGVTSTSDFINGIIVFAILIIVFISFDELSRCSATFSHPWLVTFFSYELLCSSYTPTFFAMGSAGPARVKGLRFDLAMVLLAINVIWWSGHVAHKYHATQRSDAPRSITRGPLSLLIVLLMIISIGSVAFGSERISTYNAIRALRSGKAAEYARQVDYRESLLLGHEGEDVQVPPITAKPSILYNQDLSTSSDGWENTLVADWYNLNSVVQIDSNQQIHP